MRPTRTPRAAAPFSIPSKSKWRGRCATRRSISGWAKPTWGGSAPTSLAGQPPAARCGPPRLYAFLFPTTADLSRAGALAGGVPAPARRITLAVEDASAQPMAERISVNARDAGLTVVLAPRGADADARLVEARVASSDPSDALKALAAAPGLPEPPRADSPETLYAAESALLEGFRAIPLFHLPDVFGVSPRVQGGPGITPLGEWRFQNLWLESGRP